MRCTLENTMSATTRNRIDTTIYKPLTDAHGIDLEFSSRLRIVVFRISNSTRNNFVHNICSFFRHELESIKCILGSHISDDVGNNIEFLGRNANVFYRSFHNCEKLGGRVGRVREGSQIENENASWMTYLLFITRVSHESASKREFTKLVTNHIFRDEYRNVLFPIVDTECMSDELWCNRTCARPSLDDGLSSVRIECFDFLDDTLINVRSFFKTASHK